MTTPTHITFSQLVYLLFLTTAGIPLSAWNAIVCAVGSVLPDIDTGASYVGKLFPPISRFIERRFAHRTITHCWLFQIALAVILLPVAAVNSHLYFCFLAGYMSHPFLDSCTVNGVKLLYPFSMRKCVFPFDPHFPHSFRAVTGGKVDRFLGIIFFVFCIPMYFISSEGYARAIRLWQKDIRSAVSDFNEFSRTHIVHADLKATSILSKKEIEGRFELVGSLNDHTLIFRSSDGSLYTVGDEYQANYVAHEIVCLKGEPAETSVRSLDLSNQFLSQLQFSLDGDARNYFFGTLTTRDQVSLFTDFDKFNPIELRQGLQLNYATYDHIRRQQLEDVFITKGELIVKTIVPSVPESPGPAKAGPAALTDAARFTPISFVVDDPEAVVFAVSTGDSVTAGQAIATIQTLKQHEFQMLDVLKKRIKDKKSSTEVKLAEFDSRINAAHKTQRELEEQLDRNEDLVNRGFLPKTAIMDIRDQLSTIHRELRVLQDKRKLIAESSQTEVLKLNQRISQIRDRAEEKAKKSVINATGDGLIEDIRRRPIRTASRTKYEITVIIKGNDQPHTQ